MALVCILPFGMEVGRNVLDTFEASGQSGPSCRKRSCLVTRHLQLATVGSPFFAGD
ncbi:uncharacterized protein CLUP02_01052 [Colletotrichum lupini]|uniref:Uncharacterized protein n=1 Tax=Colletotrichum lupini TaxID=145971 RepID=A0A9Q8SD86_9PEZI|nr:uncharacterized protein CLUP02_01052 [Colletotrichum lupini]UQC74402.1 hypothetical protein CLUP02_01052 [Colletotrichum lupini]